MVRLARGARSVGFLAQRVQLVHEVLVRPGATRINLEVLACHVVRDFLPVPFDAFLAKTNKLQ